MDTCIAIIMYCQRLILLFTGKQHYYYYYELYSHMTGNDVSDGNKRNVEGSELG